MTNELYVQRKINALKRNLVAVLDINQIIHPPPREAEAYIKELYTKIVPFYEALERSPSVRMHAQVYWAWDMQTKECIGFCSGEGTTNNPLTQTHNLEWELKRTVEHQKETDCPINLKLVIGIDYRPTGEPKSGEEVVYYARAA